MITPQNYGRKVRSVTDLFNLAKAKKCVLFPGWERHTPASVLLRMPAIEVQRMIIRGRLYVYKPIKIRRETPWSQLKKKH